MIASPKHHPSVLPAGATGTAMLTTSAGFVKEWKGLRVGWLHDAQTLQTVLGQRQLLVRVKLCRLAAIAGLGAASPLVRAKQALKHGVLAAAGLQQMKQLLLADTSAPAPQPPKQQFHWAADQCPLAIMRLQLIVTCSIDTV